MCNESLWCKNKNLGAPKTPLHQSTCALSNVKVDTWRFQKDNDESLDKMIKRPISFV